MEVLNISTKEYNQKQSNKLDRHLRHSKHIFVFIDRESLLYKSKKRRKKKLRLLFNLCNLPLRQNIRKTVCRYRYTYILSWYCLSETLLAQGDWEETKSNLFVKKVLKQSKRRLHQRNYVVKVGYSTFLGGRARRCSALPS